MSAANYRRRLSVTRIIWTAFCLALWLFVSEDSGFESYFSMFMAVVWFLGHPRNGAKWLARRAERQADLYAAARDEFNSKL